MATPSKTDWKFPIVIPSNPLKKTIKSWAGKIVQLTNPSIRRDLLAGKMPQNSAERAALTSIVIELEKENQIEKLSEIHKKIWASTETQGYYDLTSGRLRGMFELMKETLYTSLSSLTEQNNYANLVELGCGEGVILSNLCEKYKEHISNFVGIDINESQMELNKSVYSIKKNLEFIVGDLTQLKESIKGSNKIYMTFGGVLEYLTEAELMLLFKELASFKNTAFILYEPIKAGFDYKAEHHSILYGSEFSFSHPYYHYLSESGFEIFSEKLVESGDTNWIYLASSTS